MKEIRIMIAVLSINTFIHHQLKIFIGCHFSKRIANLSTSITVSELKALNKIVVILSIATVNRKIIPLNHV